MDETANISALLAQLLRKMADALQPDAVPAGAVPTAAPPVPVGEASAISALRQRYPAAPETWLKALAERSIPPVANETRAVPEPEPPHAEVRPEAAFPDAPAPDVPPAPGYSVQKRSPRPRPVFTEPSAHKVDAAVFATSTPAPHDEVPFQAPPPAAPTAIQYPDNGEPAVPAATDFPLSRKTLSVSSDWPVVADRPEVGGPVFPARLANPKREHSFPEPAPHLAESVQWPERPQTAASPHEFAPPRPGLPTPPVYADRPDRPAPQPMAEQTRPAWPTAPESAVATFSDRNGLAATTVRFAAPRPEQEARQWSA